MSDTTDPRAAAEEALALTGEPTSTLRASERFAERARALLTILARAVIEGQAVERGDEQTRELAHADEVLTGAGFAPMFPGEALSDRIERLKDEFGERADGDEIERLTAELASLRAELEAWREVALAQREAGIRGSALRLTRALERLADLGFDSTQPRPSLEPRPTTTEGE